MENQGYMNNPQIQPQVRQTQQPANNYAQYPANYGYQQPRQPVNVPPQSMSGVSINIISPSVYGQGGGNVPPLHPYNPIYSYPPANNNNINNNFSPVNNYAPPAPVQTQAPAPAPAPAKEEPKTKKKKVVPLTNEYIKTLENYLKNQNPQVRTTGIKQVLERFKEDDSRKNDAALTALMNIALKDKDTNVRALAMTIPAAGYASGDNRTVAMLQQIQQSKSNYNEDALLASQALMKIAENSNKVEVEVPKN